MTAELRNSSATGNGAIVEAIEQLPPPEEISQDDMELMLSFQEDITVAQRAYASLMSRFAGRYQLQQGDRINKDRTITRRSDGERP